MLIGFAGAEACQPLGVLHWHPADGKTQSNRSAHVYQVLLCSSVPEWEHISRRSLQLWDSSCKCFHFCHVDMVFTFGFALHISCWGDGQVQSFWLDLSIIFCNQLRLPLCIVSRMPLTSIKILLRKWCLRLSSSLLPSECSTWLNKCMTVKSFMATLSQITSFWEAGKCHTFPAVLLFPFPWQPLVVCAHAAWSLFVFDAAFWSKMVTMMIYLLAWHWLT